MSKQEQLDKVIKQSEAAKRRYEELKEKEELRKVIESGEKAKKEIEKENNKVRE